MRGRRPWRHNTAEMIQLGCGSTISLSYVVEQHRRAYRYQGNVRVGTVPPRAGVTTYDVPPEYGVRGYRYTVINDRPVLVEPRSRRIIEVIE
jgi:hypothetical protein